MIQNLPSIRMGELQFAHTICIKFFYSFGIYTTEKIIHTRSLTMQTPTRATHMRGGTSSAAIKRHKNDP